jgi:putative chitinase
MDTETFQRAANLAPALAERWILPITEAAHEFDINTPARLAAWIAQMGHESGGFRLLSESFNYAPDALKIFSRIPASARAQLGRQPARRRSPSQGNSRLRIWLTAGGSATATPRAETAGAIGGVG